VTLWSAASATKGPLKRCWPTPSASLTTVAWRPTTSKDHGRTCVAWPGRVVVGRGRPDPAGHLERVQEEFSAGTFVFGPGDEDIHTAVERRVTEIAGEVGARLHTGRSRNDQIATDLRLWAKRELTAIGWRVVELQRYCCDEPGRPKTPISRLHAPAAGEPVLLAHHLLAHGWPLHATSIACATPAPLDVSPLGRELWPARPSNSTRTAWPPSWVRRTLRELPRRGLRPRLRGRVAVRSGPARVHCRASARRSCCGRAKSSASAG